MSLKKLKTLQLQKKTLGKKCIFSIFLGFFLNLFKDNTKKDAKKKDFNEKNLQIIDPFGVPDRKGGATKEKATYAEKKQGEMYF